MEDYFQQEETSSSTVQSQPNNRQAEEAVLGSILLTPNLIMKSVKSSMPIIFTSFAIDGFGKFSLICMKIAYQ